eukprot:2386282-Rhodomonas_salina.3
MTRRRGEGRTPAAAADASEEGGEKSEEEGNGERRQHTHSASPTPSLRITHTLTPHHSLSIAPVRVELHPPLAAAPAHHPPTRTPIPSQYPTPRTATIRP